MLGDRLSCASRHQTTGTCEANPDAPIRIKQRFVVRCAISAPALAVEQFDVELAPEDPRWIGKLVLIAPTLTPSCWTG